MAILKVAQLGHPILRSVSDAIALQAIPSAPVQKLILDMVDTMQEYEGAGLAAPQVHQAVRLVVLTLDPERGPEAWINPTVTPLTDQQAALYEGCLSVAGLRGRVSRPSAVHVHYYDHTGTARAYALAGFPAIVAQHECDHLDGILYVDRVDPRTLSFLPEFKRFGPLPAAPHDALTPSPSDTPDAPGHADAPEDGWDDLDDFDDFEVVLSLDPDLAPEHALAELAALEE